MKRPFLVLALLFSTSLPAQAPNAVPIPQEPHHHLVLENDYVRVFRVSVPAHESTLLHQHDVPYLYVALGPADVINAVQGKPEAHLTMADGQLGYSPGHFAHIARNESDAPFNNVTIELLRPQAEPHNLCEKVAPGDFGPCFKEDTGPRGYASEPLFETKELRAELITLQAKAKFVQKVAMGCLYVALDSADLQNALGKPAIKLEPGDRIWVPAATILTLQNTASSSARYLLLTVKHGTLRTKTEGAN